MVVVVVVVAVVVAVTGTVVADAGTTGTTEDCSGGETTADGPEIVAVEFTAAEADATSPEAAGARIAVADTGEGFTKNSAPPTDCTGRDGSGCGSCDGATAADGGAAAAACGGAWRAV